jgi:uncharacterized protein
MRDPQQTNPWYREPWPWFLMAGPVAAVVGGLITAYIAVANDDPLVVDNYYKEGLAINRVLERDRAAAQGGYRAQVLFSEDHARVRVYLTAGSDPLPGSLELRLIHPTRAELDRRTALKATQAGWYEGDIAGMASATRWQVQLEGDGRDWRLTGHWHTLLGNAVILQPRG